VGRATPSVWATSKATFGIPSSTITRLDSHFPPHTTPPHFPLSPQGIRGFWTLFRAFLAALVVLVATEVAKQLALWNAPGARRIRVTDTGCLVGPLYGWRYRGREVRLMDVAELFLREAAVDTWRFPDGKLVYVIDGAALKLLKRTFTNAVGVDNLVQRHQDMDLLCTCLNEVVCATGHGDRVQFVLAPGDAEEWVKYIVFTLNQNPINRAVAVGLDSDFLFSAILPGFVHRESSSRTPEEWCSRAVLLKGFNDKARERLQSPEYPAERFEGLIKAEHLSLIALLAGDDYTVEGGVIGLVSAIVNVAKVLLQVAVGAADPLEPSRDVWERIQAVLADPRLPLQPAKAGTAKAAWEKESKKEGALRERLDRSGENVAAMRPGVLTLNTTIADVVLLNNSGTDSRSLRGSTEGEAKLLRLKVSVPTEMGGGGNAGAAAAVAVAVTAEPATWVARVRRFKDLRDRLFLGATALNTLNPALTGLISRVEDAGEVAANNLASARQAAAAEAAAAAAAAAAGGAGGAGGPGPAVAQEDARLGGVSLNLTAALPTREADGDLVNARVICYAQDEPAVMQAMELASLAYVREMQTSELEDMFALADEMPLEGEEKFWRDCADLAMLVGRGRLSGQASGGGATFEITRQVCGKKIKIRVTAAERTGLDAALERFDRAYLDGERRAETSERAAFAAVFERALLGTLGVGEKKEWKRLARGLLTAAQRRPPDEKPARATEERVSCYLSAGIQVDIYVTTAERPAVEAAKRGIRALYAAAERRAGGEEPLAAGEDAAARKRAAFAAVFERALLGTLGVGETKNWKRLARGLLKAAQRRPPDEKPARATETQVTCYLAAPGLQVGIYVTTAERPAVEAAKRGIRALYAAAERRAGGEELRAAAVAAAAASERAAFAAVFERALLGTLGVGETKNWKRLARGLLRAAQRRPPDEKPARATEEWVDCYLAPGLQDGIYVTTAERPAVEAAKRGIRALYAAAVRRAPPPPPPPPPARPVTRSRSGPRSGP
jgi:hypothetical protein